MNKVSTEANTMFANGDYAKALSLLAALKEPLDVFFDKVMVICEDSNTKNNRLALLKSLQDLLSHVADISCLQM